MMGCTPAVSRDVDVELGCGWGGPVHRRGYQEYYPSTHITQDVVIAAQSRLERHELIQSCGGFTKVI